MRLPTDIVAGKPVILAIKSIEHILPVREARLLTYLGLRSCAVRLQLNFNTNPLKDGPRRFDNTFSPRTPGLPRPR